MWGLRVKRKLLGGDLPMGVASTWNDGCMHIARRSRSLTFVRGAFISARDRSKGLRRGCAISGITGRHR